MREQLVEQLAAAKKVHADNQAKYHAAQKVQREAEAVVRKTCDAASDSANVVAALTVAVEKLPPPKPDADEKAA